MDDDNDDTVGKSDYYSFINCVSLIRFQEGSQSLNQTIQPLTVPDRLKLSCVLRLKVGVMDAEEEEDSNQLLFSSI